MQDASDSPVIDQLTAAEMSIAERTAGLSIATLEDANFPKVDILGALAWVWEKRSDQKLTFKAYMETHTLDDITKVLGIGQDEEVDGDDEDPFEDTPTET